MPPVSTNVATKTVTGTKIALATGFLAVAAAAFGLSTASTQPVEKPDLSIVSIVANDAIGYISPDQNKITVSYNNAGSLFVFLHHRPLL